MGKSINSTGKNIRGNKGNILVSQLQSKNLENVMIIPIDIGKKQHKGLIANYFGSLLKHPFKFYNTQEGIELLHNTIVDVSKHQPVEEILIGMEATGHYYKKVAAMLHEMGYNNLFIFNPLSTSYCRKAGLTWSKTDDIDLGSIGQSLISGYGTIYRPEEPLWDDLKEICRYRRFLIKHQTSLKNKLHVFFDLLLPGITELEMFKDTHLWTPASLDFFLKYPDLELIRQLQQKGIVKFFRHRGRRITDELADQLKKWTKVALRPYCPTNPCRQFIFKKLIDQLRQLQEYICQIEIKLIGYLVRTPAILLLSINYIGPIRAAEFAGESTPLEQYPGSRALIKAAGMDPTRYQSATSESSRHSISKKGSRKLRYITLDISEALMKHNQYFASAAKKLMAKGRSEECACVATGNRFIRVAYEMINNQKSFEPANGLGIHADPLNKIKIFLRDHQSSDLTEEYISHASKYFKKGEASM